MRPDYLRLLSELSCSEFDAWVEHFSEHLYTFQLSEIGIGRICATVQAASGRYKTVDENKMIPKKRKPKSIKQQIMIWKALANERSENDS